MDTDDWISPTDADDAAAAQKALDAARGALKTIGRNDEEPEYQHMVRAVLRAFAAAHKAKKQAEEAFELRHKDKNCHGFYSVELHHIVATALVSILLEAPDMPPYSLMGRKVCAFVTACLAIEHSNNAETMMSKDSSESDLSGADEAELLLDDHYA